MKLFELERGQHSCIIYLKDKINTLNEELATVKSHTTNSNNDAGKLTEELGEYRRVLDAYQKTLKDQDSKFEKKLRQLDVKMLE